MHDPSLFRKIIAPSLPSVLLHRNMLVTHLQEALQARQDGTTAQYKLVLCCAPAGYGKTTLLADFARVTSLPCCWYFLERADTDPMVFLHTLLASLRHVFPHFGASLDPIFHTLLSEPLSSTSSHYHSTLDALCAALAMEISERFVLILSNYEEINESELLTDLVNFLLKKLPSQSALIIESRVIPDLSFTSFVIQDTICGLDRDALRFSAQEIADLVRLQGLPLLTETEAEGLATAFDGWIAGIILGTRAGDARVRLLNQKNPRNDPLPAFLLQSRAEHKRSMLLRYVVEDVLKQDEEVHTFLYAISILQQIEPVLCNTLLDITDADERLARLERQGLFLTSYQDASTIVYTCHPVIRELLSEQLRIQEPERFQALHRQAAEFWRTRHNEEQALYHALAIGAYEVAVSLILNAAERLLQQGQRETLIRWLSTLPATLQESHPRLLLLQASITLERGQHTSALLLLDRAEVLGPSSDETETQVFKAMLAILRSKALFQAGEYLQAEALCQQVLRQVPAQERALRSAAEIRLGICANLQGKFSAGITHLQQALHIWANQPPLTQALEIHHALANTYYWIGNMLLAQHHLAQILDACEQVQDLRGKGDALILQGLIAQDQGHTEEAKTTFLQALTLARTLPHMQRCVAYALVNLSSLAVEQGKYTQALAYAEEGLTLAQTFGSRSLINNAYVSRALSYLFLGDPVSALLATGQMETPVLSEEVVGYERVWRDLTYGLILLTQQRYTEAAKYLAAIETALNTTDLKRESFQAKLRLATCRVAQDQPEQAVRLLEEVTSLLSAHRTYTQLVQVELQWLLNLSVFLQNHPQLASLRTLIGMSEPPQTPPKQEIAPTGPPLEKTHFPKLTIYAFGEPALLLDGQPIKRWRMASVMELFFSLLDTPHPISKEGILTALWPEYDEQTTQAFYNTVYYLRKLLGETCVVLSSAGYHLDLASCYGEQIFYDVRAFRQHQIEAEQALAQGERVCAKEAFLNMVRLYRGDYGRAFYRDWCTLRRDELRTAYLEAHRQLAQIAWDADVWNESAEHWRHMLRVDSCLEEAHYGLVRCYIRQGKRGAALRQYQICEKILQEELGVQPGQALQNLYQRLTAKHPME